MQTSWRVRTSHRVCILRDGAGEGRQPPSRPETSTTPGVARGEWESGSARARNGFSYTCSLHSRCLRRRRTRPRSRTSSPAAVIACSSQRAAGPSPLRAPPSPLVHDPVHSAISHAAATPSHDAQMSSPPSSPRELTTTLTDAPRARVRATSTLSRGDANRTGCTLYTTPPSARSARLRCTNGRIFSVDCRGLGSGLVRIEGECSGRSWGLPGVGPCAWAADRRCRAFRSAPGGS